MTVALDVAVADADAVGVTVSRGVSVRVALELGVTVGVATTPNRRIIPTRSAELRR